MIDGLAALMEQTRREVAARDALATSLTAAGKPVRLYGADGKFALAQRDMSQPNVFRLTRFDDAGPIGHTQYLTLREAIIDGLRDYRATRA